MTSSPRRFDDSYDKMGVQAMSAVEYMFPRILHHHFEGTWSPENQEMRAPQFCSRTEEDERIRQIVREEIRELRIELMGRDPLYQRILREIQAKK